MIKILLYSFFFFVKKDSCLTLNCVNNNTINNTTVENNIFKERYSSGADMRYNVINTTNEEELYRIKKHFYNKKLLSILEDDSISEYNKMLLIKYHSILEDTLNVDIKSAGLFDDWNFKI